MQAPSNKVGVTLMIVVLFVAGIIVLSKVQFPSRDSTQNLQNIQLIIERKIGENYKSEIGEQDPLWLEEFRRTELSRGIRKSAEVDLNAFIPGSITEQMSIELFTEYLLKKQQGILTSEDEQQIAEKIAQKVVDEGSLEINKYTIQDLKTTQSTPETVSIYGDRLAQVFIGNLIKMENIKNLQGSSYLKSIADIHDQYLIEILDISVPTVVQDVHIEIVNGVYNTGVLFRALSNENIDPVVALTLTAQYQAIGINEAELYTLLAQYFRSNGILFETESTVKFWNAFN